MSRLEKTLFFVAWWHRHFFYPPPPVLKIFLGWTALTFSILFKDNRRHLTKTKFVMFGTLMMVFFCFFSFYAAILFLHASYFLYSFWVPLAWRTQRSLNNLLWRVEHPFPNSEKTWGLVISMKGSLKIWVFQ